MEAYAVGGMVTFVGVVERLGGGVSGDSLELHRIAR